MPSAAVVLATVHLILQIGFISVTVLLLFVTAVNRIRVRHVLLSWRTGKLLGLPVWPMVFLGAVLLFFGSALAMGQALPWTMVVGYLIGAPSKPSVPASNSGTSVYCWRCCL